MEFCLSNKAFFSLGLGTLKYISNYKLLQQETYPHDYFTQAVDVMLRTNLKNKFSKPIIMIDSKLGGIQLFDQEFLLHIQSMSPDLIYFGKKLLDMENITPDAAEETDSSFGEGSELSSGTTGAYKEIPLYKCTLEMPRNRYCNLAYKLVDLNGEGSKELCCQIYYCGPNLFSRTLTEKLTFPLDTFITFLEKHSDTLHLYLNARTLVNKQYGRSHYLLRKSGERFPDKPVNYNKRFLEDNDLQLNENQ